VAALFFLIVWLLIGMLFGFDNTWLLILNTVATINASLMVFIILDSAVQDNKAM